MVRNFGFILKAMGEILEGVKQGRDIIRLES